MFNNDVFYFETLRKSHVIFGTQFNDMKFYRYNANGSVAQTIKVPLTPMPKNKLLQRAALDPDATKSDAITLPRMSYELTGMQYDGTRHLTHLQKVVAVDANDPDKLQRQYVPVPYTLSFELNIYTQHIDDGYKIVEQIVPFFTPSWVHPVNLVPMWQVDVPVTIKSTSPSYDYIGDISKRAVFIWTMVFDMKTYLFGPVKSKKIIKFANERFLFPSGNNYVSNTDVAASVQVTPGLTVNGTPTSNSALAVNVHTVSVDDDFGYVETFISGPVVFE